MAMNRRKFVGSILAAGAYAQVAGCTRGLRRMGNYSVRFDITGLFAFAHWQKTDKKVEALLLDGPSSIKDPSAVHAPLMIVRWDDFDDKRMGGDKYYTPPQPIQVGNETLAVWSLADRTVWVGDVNPNGYDTDTKSDLAFKMDTYGGNPPPESPNSPAEWEDIYWYADLAQVLGATPPVRVKDPELITGKLLLTRGMAGGREPKTKCDKERKYTFEKVIEKPRAFSPHLVVTHPSAGSELTLQVADKIEMEPRSIYIKVKSGQPTGISIVNAPINPRGSTDHFKAFYRLVGADPDKSPKLVVHQAQNCIVTTKAAHDDMQRSLDPAPPYEGCIPPGMPQDAP